ncbi:MarR family transcriptional regulator [Actinoplanes sp. TBRC 11911]|nr:MarR family transcriptional regulator [Actinoplanes sp. TBRC 11911]
MRKASRRLTALYDEVMAPSGLRSTQFAILRELARSAPISINELAEALVMDRSALGHSLRPLQRDGLISLDQDTTDRRSVNVTITAVGRKRLASGMVLWRSAQDRVAEVVGLQQADQLRGRLLRIAQDDRLTSL